MNYLRYCLLFVGFFISISVASDFGQPQAQPQPPILPNSWRAIGELEQGGFASNDSYMIFYDWNAQLQRVDQFVGGSRDTHTFLINYGTQMLYMYITRSSGEIKSCVTTPYYQKMPPPYMFAGAAYSGHSVIHGKDCNGWKIDNAWVGNMHLWVTSATNTPVRFASYGSRFDLSDFLAETIPAGTFDVPNLCKD